MSGKEWFPGSDPRRQLLLVDGHAYAYRAYYAIRQLTSPQGIPTNAIFGFVKMWQKVRERLQPSHAMVIWDGGMSEERLALLPEYKAQRAPMPESLGKQIDCIQAFLDAAGISWRCEEGVEADDGIATVARHAESDNFSVLIASSDKDFMQLVSPKIGLVNPGDSDGTIGTEERVVKKSGVKPGQIVDWLSLIGDTVDNIEGVRGVGPKTAAKLLNKFGSLEGLAGRLEELKGSDLYDQLLQSQEILKRNRKMIQLQSDLDAFKSELSQIELKAQDKASLRSLYQQWGFSSMVRELDAGEVVQGTLFN